MAVIAHFIGLLSRADSAACSDAASASPYPHPHSSPIRYPHRLTSHALANSIPGAIDLSDRSSQRNCQRAAVLSRFPHPAHDSLPGKYRHRRRPGTRASARSG
jgi:hypothetical protein